MKGSCACGAVSVEIDAAPEYINLCDCSVCSPTGAAWGYFAPGDVSITGETRGYRRVESEKPAAEFCFCPICGSTTHFILTEHAPAEMTGVNMRIFTPDQVHGIEARTLDGRNWHGTTDPEHRRPPGMLGEDVFL